jgi:hypothetical protein
MYIQAIVNVGSVKTDGTHAFDNFKFVSNTILRIST